MSAQNDIAPHELSFKVLEVSDDLSAFDCSKDDDMGLNEFIHKEGLQYQNEKLGVTSLFFYNGKIVGFATLAMSQIEIKLAPALLPFKVTIKDYPALLIGRIAAHNEYRDRHIGKSICLWCIEKAKEMSKEIGCKLVIVLTKERLVKFYQRVGFEIVEKSKNKERQWMFLKVP
jgi:predicted GNAT family N-acyltransferase